MIQVTLEGKFYAPTSTTIQQLIAESESIIPDRNSPNVDDASIVAFNHFVGAFPSGNSSTLVKWKMFYHFWGMTIEGSYPPLVEAKRRLLDMYPQHVRHLVAGAEPEFPVDDRGGNEITTTYGPYGPTFGFDEDNIGGM